MDLLSQVALILLPTGAMLILTIQFLRKQSERENKNFQFELKKERQNYFLPNRLESYQRALLLMERIHPNSLVMRLHNPSLPSNVFLSELLNAVREEYDHNVAQQLFISPEAWRMVKESKDETVKILNLAGRQMPSTAMATDLATKIFEIVGEVGTLPTEITIDYIKKEFQTFI